ncbi:hypothetical protein INT48_006955 [Thamnidium elegans]|uniref:DNA-directed RNA polymerase II subunit RPB9 n=1 Tax=Thamnidium elegans TaxID=101142 RepID=A0A8H7SXD6_9FUNG|nr:hypothetical protein INT48_006955 [Thamnidium elegans]
MFACRNCQYEEEAENVCVYRHEIVHAPSYAYLIYLEQTMMLADLSTDPTLPRANVQCARCGNPEAVFFQSSSRRADAKMALFYVCGSKSCGYRWTE